MELPLPLPPLSSLLPLLLQSGGEVPALGTLSDPQQFPQPHSPKKSELPGATVKQPTQQREEMFIFSKLPQLLCADEWAL